MVCAGCSSEPHTYPVSGSVSYQNEAVIEGTIIFASADGAGPTAVARIENGRYEILTTAGEKRVRITATKETGRMLTGAMEQKYPETVDIIPPKYNTATTLVRNVDPDGDLIVDFLLE